MFWKEEFIEELFRLMIFIFIFIIMWGDGDEMNISLLRTLGKYFLIEVEIFKVEKVVKVVDIVKVGTVRVRVAEGKIYLLLFTGK